MHAHAHHYPAGTTNVPMCLCLGYTSQLDKVTHLAQWLQGCRVFWAGMISWEISVFKEGGKIFPWRNLRVSAGQ